MNRIYRLVFNHALGQVQVTSEIGASPRAATGASRRLPARLRLLPLALALAYAAGAQAVELPGSGAATGATISINGNTMTITQAQAKALIHWGSFNIGEGGAVNITTPDANSVTLNMVSSGTPSSIDGALKSNGHVFLINPSGIAFGSGAQVSVAGLVASSLALSQDDDNRNYVFAQNGAAAGVSNAGAITSSGPVVLMGSSVSNSGVITGGTVNLISAGNVLLTYDPLSGATALLNGATSSLPGGTSAAVSNTGTITADRIVLQANLHPALAASAINLGGAVVATQLLSADVVGGGLQISGDVNAESIRFVGDKGVSQSAGRLVTRALDLNVTGDAALSSATNEVARIGGTVSGNLALSNSTALTQTGALEVTGTTALSNVSKDVALTNAGNRFGGNVSLDAGNVAISAAGSLALGNVKVDSLDATAGSIYLPAVIRSAGAQRYNGAVVLGRDTALSSSLGTIRFNGVIDGAHALSVTAGGEVSFGGAVGGSTALTSLDVAGASGISLPSNVTTTGMQRYGGPVNLWGATSLGSQSAGAIDFSSTINGAHGLTVNTAGTTTFAGAIGGTTALASLTTDAAGSTRLGGNVRTTGSQTYGDTVSLTGPVTVSSAAAGNISFGSSVTGTAGLVANTTGRTTFGGVVNLDSLITDAGGSTQLGGNVTTRGAQTYDDELVLAGNVTLTSTHGDSISINAGANGAHSLSVNTAGTTTLAGGLGSTTALASLMTDGVGDTRLSGVVRTSGNQIYGDKVVLFGNTALTSFSNSIFFQGTLDGAHALTTNAAAQTHFQGDVGATNALASLAVSAGSFGARRINTSGNLSLNVSDSIAQQTGAYSVGGDASFASDGDLLLGAENNFHGKVALDGSDVQIFANSALDISHAQATTLGAQAFGALALDNATIGIGGATLIGGAMLLGSITVTDGGHLWVDGGSISQFGTLDVSGASVFNARVGNITLGARNAFGGHVNLMGTDVLINAGDLLKLGGVSARNLEAGAAQLQFFSNITTTGYQRYVGALGLTRDTSLVAGGALNITGSIDGGFGLALNSGSAVRIAGGVGQSTALSSLSVSGPAAIDSAVTTTGAQTFNGALQLNGDSSLTSLQGNLTLAAVDGPHALALNAGNGAVHVGSVGASSALTRLQVDSAALGFLGTSVTTSGAQQYNASVVMTKDVALASIGVGDIGFGGSIDGGYALQVNTAGVTRFGGTVGGITALASLTTNAAGTTELGGGVTASGNVAFNDAVNLKALTSVHSQNGTTTFGSTVVGPWALAATGGAGTIFGGAVNVRSLLVQGGGTTTLGGDVSVDTSAVFNRPVLLTDDVTVDARTVSFAGAINGAHALDIAATGAVTIGDHIGATTALDALTVRGASLNTQGIRTTGNLAVDVVGDITQTAAYSVGGAANFKSQGNITLGNIGNNFGGAVALDGGAIQIASAFALDLDVVQADSLSATAYGGLRLGNAVIAGSTFLSGNGIVFDDATIQGQLGAISNGSIQQSGALNVAGTSQLNAADDIILSNPQNAFGDDVSVGADNADIVSSTALSLGTSSVGHLKARTAGDLRLTGQIYSNNVDLATDGNFDNRYGASAIRLNGNGRWHIYLSSPTSAHNFGNLDSGNTAIWNTGAFAGTSAAGNRYLFAWQPTLTVTGAVLHKIYGDTADLTNAFTTSGLMGGVAGAYFGDSFAGVFSGMPHLTSTGASGNANASTSPYAIDVAQGTLDAGSSGYALTFAPGQLFVDRRALNITAQDGNKTYGQNGGLGGYRVDGLLNTDNVASVDLGSNGTGATANVGNYTITASNADGTGLSNYDITYTDGVLSIGKAGLTITANNGGKTYGQNGGLAGYRVDGLLNTDNVASVDLGSNGSAATANVGDYTITASNADGTGLSNYDITYTDGVLSIGKAGLTITANNASKNTGQSTLFNGYTADGLLNGDTLDGVKLSSNGGDVSAKPGTYTIVASDAHGAQLGNYDVTYREGTLEVVDVPNWHNVQIGREVAANLSKPVARALTDSPDAPLYRMSDAAIRPASDACTSIGEIGCLARQPE